MRTAPAGDLAIHAAQQTPDRAIEAVADDRLERRPFMEAIASVADAESTQAPFNIAVSSPWGGGKSSVLNGVEQILEERPPTSARARTVVARFDAWHHDDAVDIKADLYQCVLRHAAPARSLKDRIVNPVSRRLLGLPPTTSVAIAALRHALIVAAAITLAYAVVVVAALQWMGVQILFDVFGLALGGLTAAAHSVAGASAAYTSLVAAALLAGIRWMTERSSPLHTLSRRVPVVQSHRLGQLRHSLHEVLDQIHGGRRLVLLVENLDRCKPENIRSVLEALRQVLDSRKLVAIVAIDPTVIMDRLEQVEGWGVKDARGLLTKTFDLRLDLPLVPTQTLPHVLANERPAEDSLVVKMTPTERLIDALVLFFVPSYWAWRRDSGRKITGASEHWAKDYAAGFLLVLLFPVLSLHESRNKVFRTYPRVFRDSEAELGRKHVALSTLPVVSTAALGWLSFQWISSTGSGVGIAVVGGLFTVLIVHGPIISFWAGVLYVRDEGRLAAWREARVAMHEPEPIDALPPRLRGARATATMDEIRWHRRLNHSKELRSFQSEALARVALTPREYKQWTNRLRVTLALSQSRHILSSDRDLPLWCMWTLMQELSPDLTEAAARASFGEDDHARLEKAKQVLPAACQIAWSKPDGIGENLTALLFLPGEAVAGLALSAKTLVPKADVRVQSA